MNLKDIAHEVENLSIEAKKVNALQEALNQAIFRGDLAAETYEWAFIALGDITYKLEQKMEVVTRALFDVMRKEE